MGNKQSSQPLISDDVPPVTLSRRSLEAVAEYIQSGKVCNIVVMVGAGMSTSSGIPDFRSPGTGLYHNLQRLDIPEPEAVFDIDFFQGNPMPFYQITKEIQADHCRPTYTHVLIAEFHKRGLLQMCFTQNIDTLERKAGIPPEKLVEAHGTYATQSCTRCGAVYPDDLMAEHVDAQTVPICPVKGCNGYVKPDIVFFGQPLPERFHRLKYLPRETDLAIVIGSSLQVYPFALLPMEVPDKVPRVLFNNQLVGDFGTRPDDVTSRGTCDDCARVLATELGWHEDVEREWLKLAGEEEAAKQVQRNTESSKQMNMKQREAEQESLKEEEEKLRQTTKPDKESIESDVKQSVHKVAAAHFPAASEEHHPHVLSAEQAHQVEQDSVGALRDINTAYRAEPVGPIMSPVSHRHNSVSNSAENSFNPAKLPNKPAQASTVSHRTASGVDSLIIGGISIKLDSPMPSAQTTVNGTNASKNAVESADNAGPFLLPLTYQAGPVPNGHIILAEVPNDTVEAVESNKTVEVMDLNHAAQPNMVVDTTETAKSSEVIKSNNDAKSNVSPLSAQSPSALRT